MSVFEYLKAVRAELKEVVWPTRNQTISFTILVIIISVAASIFLGGVDFGLKTLLTHLIK